MNYKGVSCPVCGQPFQEGDDIVVCPECGAPHHRACYKQLGHCAMEQQLHPQHLSWQNPNDQPPAAAADGSDDIICPIFGLFCHSEDESCPNCHFPLKNKTESQPSNNNQRPVVENPFDEVSGQEQSPDFESMFGAIYENDQIGGFAAKDFIFVIRQNYVYFLRVFKILAQRVKAKVFNWSAFFFGFLYFFYRKMYKIGALLFGFYILSNVPALVLSFHMLEQTLADPMLMSSLQFDLTGLGGWQIAAQLLMYVRFGVSISQRILPDPFVGGRRKPAASPAGNRCRHCFDLVRQHCHGFTVGCAVKSSKIVTPLSSAFVHFTKEWAKAFFCPFFP